MMKTTKKMKRVSMDSSCVVVDEEARMRFKYQSLLQDFDELQRESEVIKKRLQKAKGKKLTLLAEVRFLRRRYKFLSMNPSREIDSEHLIRPQNPVIQREGAAKERICSEKETAFPRPSTKLDLNQASLQIDNAEASPVTWEPLSMEKKRKACLTEEEEEAPANNLNLSICRDIGSGSNRSVKRRVTWQDPVALRV